MHNVLSWFEVPCTDLGKAQGFYESVLAITLRPEPMGPSQGAVFPYDKAQGAMGGALMSGPSAPTPAKVGDGVVVYLNGAPYGLQELLGRVLAAGGQVVMPSQELPAGRGWIAHIRDLEGNKIGLHTLAP